MFNKIYNVRFQDNGTVPSKIIVKCTVPLEYGICVSLMNGFESILTLDCYR